MKKFSYVFSFLNKKGVFALGIIVGLLFSLFMVSRVSAESIDYGDYVEVFRADCQNGVEWVVYMSESNIDIASMCWIKNNNYPNSVTWYCPSKPSIPVAWRYTSQDYLSYDKYEHLASTQYVFESTCFYIFENASDAEAYFNGESDGSNALNYEEVHNSLLEKNKVYDSAIPIPDDLSISSCSASGVQAVWQYSDNTKLLYNSHQLYYDVEFEYLYSSMSASSGFIFGHTGSGASQGLSIDASISNLQTVKAEYTVEDYLKQGNALVNNLLKSATVDKSNGIMNPVNTFTGVPTDYSKQFVSSGNPFFTGATNSTHAIFIGSQVTVIPYYVDDSNIKHYGNSSVTRKFINGITNTVSGGSTTVVVGTDGEGNQYFESSYTPSYSEGSDFGSLNSDNITEYVSKGFGLLGDDGYIELSRRFLVGVPTTIWVLIFMAMSVNIAVLLFKIIRGF